MDDKTPRPNPYLDLPFAEERLAGYEHLKALVGMIVKTVDEMPAKATAFIDMEGGRWASPPRSGHRYWFALDTNGSIASSAMPTGEVIDTVGPLVITEIIGVPDADAERVIKTREIIDTVNENFDQIDAAKLDGSLAAKIRSMSDDEVSAVGLKIQPNLELKSYQKVAPRTPDHDTFPVGRTYGASGTGKDEDAAILIS